MMFLTASHLLTSFLSVAGYANMFVGSVFQLGFLPPKTYFFLGNLTLNSCYAEIKSNLTWLALYFDTGR